jgi:hypothetical protein
VRRAETDSTQGLSIDEKERTNRDGPVGGGEKGLNGQSRKVANRGHNEGRGEITKIPGGERMSFGAPRWKKRGSSTQPKVQSGTARQAAQGTGAGREGKADTHNSARRKCAQKKSECFTKDRFKSRHFR